MGLIQFRVVPLGSVAPRNVILSPHDNFLQDGMGVVYSGVVQRNDASLSGAQAIGRQYLDICRGGLVQVEPGYFGRIEGNHVPLGAVGCTWARKWLVDCKFEVMARQYGGITRLDVCGTDLRRQGDQVGA